MASWWDSADDFLSGVTGTAEKVNDVAGTIADFGKGKVQLAYEDAQIKAMSEQAKVNYNNQLAGTTATNSGLSSSNSTALMIGGAVIGALLLLG